MRSIVLGRVREGLFDGLLVVALADGGCGQTLIGDAVVGIDLPRSFARRGGLFPTAEADIQQATLDVEGGIGGIVGQCSQKVLRSGIIVVPSRREPTRQIGTGSRFARWVQAPQLGQERFDLVGRGIHRPFHTRSRGRWPRQTDEDRQVQRGQDREHRGGGDHRGLEEQPHQAGDPLVGEAGRLVHTVEHGAPVLTVA